MSDLHKYYAVNDENKVSISTNISSLEPHTKHIRNPRLLHFTINYSSYNNTDHYSVDSTHG